VSVGYAVYTGSLAQVAVPRQMFAEILSFIALLRAAPAPDEDAGSDYAGDSGTGAP